MNDEDTLTLMRAAVRKRAPYWSAAVLGFVYEACPGCETMFVTARGVVGYDPAFLAVRPLAELATSLAHETCHFVFDHHGRRGDRDPERWNEAGDLAVNDLLAGAGWEVPKDFLQPGLFRLPRGLTAEQYYDRRIAKAPRDSKPRGGGSARVGAGHCGGAAGHATRAEVERALDERIARSPLDTKRIQRQVAKDSLDYAQRHGRGALPGGALDWAVAAHAAPQIAWRDELEAVLRDATGRIRSGGADFSLRRLSRRSFAREIVRPGLVDRDPTIAFVLDTSASMGRAELGAALREAAGILRDLDVDEVAFAEADAAVAMDFRRVGAGFFDRLALHGRGGTDFRPAFAAARALDPRPDLVVYFTDGDGVAPANPPDGLEVVWCLVGAARAPAPWGRAVQVKAA